MADLLGVLLCKVFGHRPPHTEAELWPGRLLPVDPYCPRCLMGLRRTSPPHHGVVRPEDTWKDGWR